MPAPPYDVNLVECEDFDDWVASQIWFNDNALTNADRSQVDPDFNGVACDHPDSPHDSGVNAPAGQDDPDSSSDSEADHAAHEVEFSMDLGGLQIQ